MSESSGINLDPCGIRTNLEAQVKAAGTAPAASPETRGYLPVSRDDAEFTQAAGEQKAIDIKKAQTGSK